MRGDETQPAAGGGAVRGRREPRHAAPRKSLLTMLQAPAGKALALAAMPTAVLVGMSLTPRPALADEKDIPFAPGPCVTRSDEPAEPRPDRSPSASPSAAPSPGGEAETPAPTGRPSADGTAGPTASPAREPREGGSPAATPSATPAPSPTGSPDPLDPLGVGKAVQDLLGGLTGRQGQAGTVSPAPAPAGTPTAPAAAEPAVEPTAKPADEVPDRAEEAIREAAGKVGAAVEELPEDVKGLEPRKDEDVPDDAKPRFPCPTPDPQALADAEPETGIPHVADDPWRLESTVLTLRGLRYHGIVEVRTGSGTTKKALKFTASEVDIKDLHQLTVHSEGRTGHVASRPGSTSTIRGGTVTMYTEELKGDLFGLIPITFSPETPPPLDVPFAFFTDARVVQAAQFGGTLAVPGLHNYVEG